MKPLIVIMLLSVPLYAQETSFNNTLKLPTGMQSPPATLESIDWLRGEWTGEGLGGYCEEIWSKAKAGSMLGIFRMIKDDQLGFSEYMEIKESDGSILLRLKHYGNDFVGWEAKDKHVEFKLVKITDDTVYFDGLTYRRTGDHSMEVYVIITTNNGSSEEKFSYQRL